GLAEHFADRLDVIPSAAGLHITAYADGDPAELAARARASGLALYTLSEVAMSRSVRPGLVFGYGAIAAPDIGPALRRLSVV
ncbi:PLP-dependent aminotransferase family protein, partial [Streptomyces sp. 2MCAF27]